VPPELVAGLRGYLADLEQLGLVEVIAPAG
jgi:hypothetical protein